jgi:RNA polymerase sigma-70 factor (ECF subfamily)
MRYTQKELDLIARMQARDGSAVAALAAEYGPRIQQLALRYLKNREDAEEVTQDVLLKVYQNIGRFRGDAALSSWIYRITFNAAMSRLRARRTSETGSGIDWSSMPDEQALRRQFKRRLWRALTALPPIYRTPIVLRDLKGLSTEEASAVLQVRTQTLKSRLHRGRLILRAQLRPFNGGLTLHRAAA